jgi:hypothetical protein
MSSSVGLISLSAKPLRVVQATLLYVVGKLSGSSKAAIE